MKINIGSLTDARRIDLNCLEAKLGDNVVKFSRQQHGWAVHLRITVNDLCVHDTPATDVEFTAWHDLEELVWRKESISAREQAAFKANVCRTLFSV